MVHKWTRRAFVEITAKSAAVAAVVVSLAGNLWASIADSFGGSLTNWYTMRGTWDTTTNSGQLTVTGLQSGDGDAGLIYSAEQTATQKQWVEVKLVSIPNFGGDCSGPFVLCSAASTTASHAWLRYVLQDQMFYLDYILNGVWGNNFSYFAYAFTLPGYVGIEIIGPLSNAIVNVYDNGAASKAYGTWGAPVGSFRGVNISAVISTGKYTGLWYGDGGARTTPGGVFDDFKAGDVLSHDFDTNVRFTGTANPLTHTYTPGSGCSLITLGIVTAGTTNRAGGAPTYNGVAMSQADSVRKAATSPESIAELWYILAPPSGAQTISIPNTNGATLYAQAASFTAPTGYTTALDVASGGNNNGSANPSVSVTTTVAGDVIVGVLGCGNDSAPSAQTGFSLNRTDDGAYSDNNQYMILGNYGTWACSWTVGSDDWGMCVAAFKLVAAASGVRKRVMVTSE